MSTTSQKIHIIQIQSILKAVLDNKLQKWHSYVNLSIRSTEDLVMNLENSNVLAVGLFLVLNECDSDVLC